MPEAINTPISKSKKKITKGFETILRVIIARCQRGDPVFDCLFLCVFGCLLDRFCWNIQNISSGCTAHLQVNNFWNQPHSRWSQHVNNLIEHKNGCNSNGFTDTELQFRIDANHSQLIFWAQTNHPGSAFRSLPFKADQLYSTKKQLHLRQLVLVLNHPGLDI